MSYMSVDLEAKSTKERCIQVAAIAIVIQAGGWNICVEVSHGVSTSETRNLKVVTNKNARRRKDLIFRKELGFG